MQRKAKDPLGFLKFTMFGLVLIVRSKKMKASVIVPTYNKLSRLRLFLESMKGQNCSKTEFEVVLVNDGSSDQTKEFLDQYEYEVPCKVVHINNSGRAFARNRGIVESEGDILIFCDDDMILPPDYVSSHIKEQESIHGSVVHGCIYSLSYLKYFQDPTIGVQYDNGICTNKYLLMHCIDLEDIRVRFDTKFRKERKKDIMETFVVQTFQNKSSDYYWVSLNGGNVSVPRDWIIEAGMFEERFGKQWGGEDIELGYRLYKQGRSFVYSEAAYNYHMCHLRKNVDIDMKNSFIKFYEMHKDERIMQVYERMRTGKVFI